MRTRLKAIGAGQIERREMISPSVVKFYFSLNNNCTGNNALCDLRGVEKARAYLRERVCNSQNCNSRTTTKMETDYSVVRVRIHAEYAMCN